MQNKPRRAFHLIARVEGDTREALATHLMSIAYQIERDKSAGPSISGGYDSGHILFLHVNESMTHSAYFDALNAELDKQLANEKQQPPSE